MYALRPRRPTFVCIACQCNRLGHAHHPNHLNTADFTSSTKYAVRKVQLSPSKAKAISASPEGLESLRESLLSKEKQEGGKKAPAQTPASAKETPKTSKTKKRAKSSAKLDANVDASKFAQKDDAKKSSKKKQPPLETESATESPGGKSVKNTKSTKLKIDGGKGKPSKETARPRTKGAKKSGKIEAKTSNEEMAVKTPQIRKYISNSVTYSGLGYNLLSKLNKSGLVPSNSPERTTHDLVKLIESGTLSPAATVNAVRQLRASLSQSSRSPQTAIENASRDDLVRIIESGDLSPKDTVSAVRKLRASLVGGGVPPSMSGIDSAVKIGGTELKASVGKTLDPVQHGINQGGKLFRTLKDAMQSQQQPLKARETRVQTPLKTSSVPRAVVTGPIEMSKAEKDGGNAIQALSPDDLILTPVEKVQPPVPRLAHGLERVLFNPGVYHLQDPRSRVFNFDPYLQKPMPVEDFDFNALKQYITSSKDTTLLSIVKEEKKKYTGSTSSMSAALAHFHFLLSQWRPINPGMLSQNFPVEYHSFTSIQRGPSAIFLRYKDGVYAIDADKEFDTSNILALLGKSLEKFLTLPKEHFEKYRKENSGQLTEEDRNDPETFHYSTLGDFLLRSQLDAYDPRIPGTGMFDLKTRAVVSIRMDVEEYKEGMGYEIKGRHGEWQSFEREYYDMIRAAFLKYSLQVRMGRMDGIFVAFHNIERIFGFQYISLPEMDYALHGTEDTTIGDNEFKLSLDLMNKILDQATEKFPQKSLRLHYETRVANSPFMYIFAEPFEDDEIESIQSTNRAKIEKFEREVLSLTEIDSEDSLEEKKDAEWQELRQKVEDSMKKDEIDIQDMRAIAETMLEESEYWDDLSPEEKEKCIESLLKSPTFDEDLPEKQDNEESGAVVEDDLAEDGVDEDNAIDVDDLGEEKEDIGLEVQDTTEVDNEFEMDDIAKQTPADQVTSEANAETAHSEASDSIGLGSLGIEVSKDHTSPEVESVTDTPLVSPEKPLLAMILVIRNLVDGEYVERPEDLERGAKKWTIEYSLTEIASGDRARTLYNACKRRRYDSLHQMKKEDAKWTGKYVERLRELSKQGRQWRNKQDRKEAKTGQVFLDDELTRNESYGSS